LEKNILSYHEKKEGEGGGLDLIVEGRGKESNCRECGGGQGEKGWNSSLFPLGEKKREKAGALPSRTGLEREKREKGPPLLFLEKGKARATAGRKIEKGGVHHLGEKGGEEHVDRNRKWFREEEMEDQLKSLPFPPKKRKKKEKEGHQRPLIDRHDSERRKGSILFFLLKKEKKGGHSDFVGEGGSAAGGGGKGEEGNRGNLS